MNCIHAARPLRPRIKALLNIGIKYFDSATHSCVLGAVGNTANNIEGILMSCTSLSAGPEHNYNFCSSTSIKSTTNPTSF